MSAIEEYGNEDGFTLPEGLTNLLARVCWAWADAHQHDIVLKKKILFLSVTITVRDCEWLIGSLIGPRP